MEARGLVWTLLLLLVGGGSCQPSAQHTKAFLDAAQLGDLEKVKALLNNNSDLLFSKDTIGMTALHLAAKNGHKDMAELLLANKAEINDKAYSGWTPLHEAAAKGHKDVVELLLANQDEVNAKTNKDWTALRLATAGRHEGVAELLRQHGGHE
jgi:ankyrin repeat protein